MSGSVSYEPASVTKVMRSSHYLFFIDLYMIWFILTYQGCYYGDLGTYYGIRDLGGRYEVNECTMNV